MSATLSLTLGANGIPSTMRLRNELNLARVWPSFLGWLAVSVGTLGLGWLVVSGRFFRLVINNTIVVGAGDVRMGRLICDYDVERRPGHVAMWIGICIATLGVGLLFYSFHAARAALNATVVEWD